MSQSFGRPTALDELIPAPIVAVADMVVQPIARLEGWVVAGPAGAAALGRLTPATIHVRRGEREDVVPIAAADLPAVRTFLLFGAVVSLVCVVIMLLTTVLTRR
ncbi:MAG: hypothetical protein KF832_03365 [Caldilineaceae bacterium]|nr:hypothetical protein [Caldilineaceae bacterium]